MFSQFLKFNSIFVLFIGLVMSSCQKEDPVTGDSMTDDNLEVISRDDPDSPHRPGCFEIVYPVSIAFPDGSTADAANGQELRQIMREWREANPTSSTRPSFVYPITVIFESETEIEVQSTEELRALRDDCEHPIGINWYRARRCFNLVYPLSVSFPDGSSAEAGTPVELRQLLGEWRMENPDAEGRPAFVFPISVEFNDGDIVEVEDAESLQELRDNCDHPSGPFWHRHRWCIELVYPITIQFPSGATATVIGPRQLYRILRIWRFTHPNAEEGPSLVYPIQATLPNGNVVEIEGPAGLRAILEACERPCGPFDHPSFRCYDLVFPVTLVFPDGSTAEAVDGEALRNLIIDWRVENPDATERPSFAFPIEVELPNGNTVTVEDAEMLYELREACQRPCRPLIGRCFRFIYPLTVSLPNGETVDANNAQQLKTIIRTWRQNNPDSEERPSLVYPFQVELQEDDSVVTVENAEQFHMLIESCHP